MGSQVHGSEASTITTQACDFQYISPEDFTLLSDFVIPSPQSQQQTSTCRNLVEDETYQEMFEGLSNINHLESILTPDNIFSDKKSFPSVLNKVKSSGRKVRFAIILLVRAKSDSKITLEFFFLFDRDIKLLF